jgi:hypothetical protein
MFLGRRQAQVDRCKLRDQADLRIALCFVGNQVLFQGFLLEIADAAEKAQFVWTES